jgi:hypothetical protein
LTLEEIAALDQAQYNWLFVVPKTCLSGQQKARLKAVAISDFEVGFFTTLLGHGPTSN